MLSTLLILDSIGLLLYLVVLRYVIAAEAKDRKLRVVCFGVLSFVTGPIAIMTLGPLLAIWLLARRGE